LEFTNDSDISRDALNQIKEKVLQDQRLQQSIIPMKTSTLFRTHKTRVEFDLNADANETKQNISYIKNDENITDIVFSAKNDASVLLYKLENIIRSLEEANHITAFRIRSLKFNYQPNTFNRTIINKLASFSNKSTVNSKRIEIETQFLHSSEIQEEHGKIAAAFRKKGITVYNNTPLLPFINDSKEEIMNLAYKLRKNGIEFHHLYISGLPMQIEWEEEYPVDVNNILDIATHIRRHESGREIPRFIIRTELGEVDFGLTSTIYTTDELGRLSIAVKPYDLKYFKSMYKEYTWPEGLQFNEKNVPVTLVPGLKKTSEFLVD
jgi:L-lysine 2,3-aminomutase